MDRSTTRTLFRDGKRVEYYEYMPDGSVKKQWKAGERGSQDIRVTELAFQRRQA